MRALILGTAIIVLLLCAVRQTVAMQFRAGPPDDGVVIIQADGEIIPGDVQRLFNALTAEPKGFIIGLALDSPGGNLGEAEKLAGTVVRGKLPVLVAQDARCVSACFLLFAAAPLKFAAPDALIGVHSASQSNGQETALTMALTTAMARDAASLGVPDAIVGKMVETVPGGVSWLTHDDLASMGVKFIAPKSEPPQVTTAPTSDSRATIDPNQSGSQPVPTPRSDDVSSTAESQAFQDGLAQRRKWEAWFSGLTGDYRDGASFWASHRSDHSPPSCETQRGVSMQWRSGCLGAEQQLSYSDGRRRAEPDFRQGWNSF